MRLWIKRLSPLLLTMLALCACAPAPSPSTILIHNAAVRERNGAWRLDATLRWQLGREPLAALEHGIPLRFELRLEAQGESGWLGRPQLAVTTRHIELRYFPLSRQYRMLALEGGSERSFAHRTQLLAALDQLRLDMGTEPWPTASRPERFVFGVELDRAALPAPLRLPALFLPAWRLQAAEFVWQNPPRGA